MDISTIKFDYIKSNQYKSEYDADENNGKKGYEVLSGGFIFAKKKQNKDSNYWQCKHKKCKASITIGFDDKVINISSNQHNIIQPSSEIPEADWHVPLQENQIKTLSFLKKVKERVSNGEECGTAKIWEDEQNKLFKTLMTDQDKDEVASLIPAFSSLKHGLQKRKSKNRPKLPTSLSSIVIDGKYTTTSNGIDKFLIYKTRKNSKLVFCSKTGLEVLSKSSEWHCDGTFYTASKYFYQLYLLHAYFKGRMIPCAFILMNRRRRIDYEAVIDALIKEASKYDFVLEPKRIMTDLELAAIQAFKAKFPSVQNKACLFHFAQALLKHFTATGYFKIEYNNDVKINNWFRRLFCLSLIPIDRITEVWSIKRWTIFLNTLSILILKVNSR